MLHMEYVRNVNCNYERILLEEKPNGKLYQYCILGRGEVGGLLPSSLRYIDGSAYLYYDITSRQNVSHLYSNRCITREWLTDFVWSLKRVQQELQRFLLDIHNILWYPEQIFQDLESNIFSFVYVPYYKGEPSFIKLVEFWVEHIDYSDEELVECVYRMYEKIERNGEIYLQARIFEDTECLENRKKDVGFTTLSDSVMGEIQMDRDGDSGETETYDIRTENETRKSETGEKKGIRGFLGAKKKKDKKSREEYQRSMQRAMTGYAVAEETPYTDETYGQTVYVEEGVQTERIHRLCTPEGELLGSLEVSMLSVGKKKGEVDLALKDSSVSRIHARVTNESGTVYLEDLNSTNGTFRNSVRLQPYEKQRLDEGDEIRFGNVVLIFH